MILRLVLVGLDQVLAPNVNCDQHGQVASVSLCIVSKTHCATSSIVTGERDAVIVVCSTITPFPSFHTDTGMPINIVLHSHYAHTYHLILPHRHRYAHQHCPTFIIARYIFSKRLVRLVMFGQFNFCIPDKLWSKG